MLLCSVWQVYDSVRTVLEKCDELQDVYLFVSQKGTSKKRPCKCEAEFILRRRAFFFFIALSHAQFHLFLGHMRLTSRLISQHYPQSDAAPWVEKSLTSKVFHTHDTGLYWLTVDTLQEGFIGSHGVESEWKMLQVVGSDEKKCFAF